MNEALARHLDPISWATQDRTPSVPYSGCAYSIALAGQVDEWLKRHPNPGRVEIARCFGPNAWREFDRLCDLNLASYAKAMRGEELAHELIGYSLRMAERVMRYLATVKPAKAAA